MIGVGSKNENVVALCADLIVFKFDVSRKNHPRRFPNWYY
jgi:hypothetical protein